MGEGGGVRGDARHRPTEDAQLHERHRRVAVAEGGEEGGSRVDVDGVEEHRAVRPRLVVASGRNEQVPVADRPHGVGDRRAERPERRHGTVARGRLTGVDDEQPA